MSTKSTSLSGDLSLGRNLAVGGRADVQGSATVHHNLKVEGWLDAKNIKGANKGVFTTIEKLKEAYPNGTLPEGSWAIVGGTLPGELWYVSGGVWVDSGKTAGSVTVDVESYLEEIQSLSGEVSTLQDDVSDIQDKDKSQDNQITTISNIATANSNSITQLQTNLATETSERKSADTTLQGNIDSLKTQLQTNLATETSERKSADTTLQSNIDSLKEELESLLGDSASDAIDNFNEILAFLNGVKDSETLTALLEAIRTRLTSLETLQGQGYRLVGIATPTTTPVTSSGNIAYIAAVPGTYTNFTAQKLNSDGTSEDVAIELADGEVALLFKQNYDKSQVVGWGKSVLSISDAVEAIVKDRLVGVEGGVAPLNREGVVPLDFLPEEATVAGNIMVEEWSDSVDSTYTPTVPDGYFYNPTDKKLYKSYANSDGDFMIKAVMPNTSTIYVNKPENVPYRWTGSDMVAIAAKNISASIFNPTVENDGRTYVLCDTEDTSNSALHVAKKNKKASLGLMITFALKKGTWKTYQYVGGSTDDEYWYDTDNWKDFGSMVQGSEQMIDIDKLVPLSTGYYTLGTALSALKTYQESSGVSYQKRGFVISYAVEANKVETKQYQGDSALTDDFWEAGLWQDFGGGNELVANDSMEDGGTDAFSNGGAYKYIPTDVETESEEGSVSLNFKNKGGDTLFQAQFAVGTGSGSAGGTTVAINFEDDPFYVLAGGTALVKAAIRSVTQLADGSSQENKIVSAVFINRTTKTTVASFKPNQASSGTLKSYTFEFDLTSLAASAGSTELQLQATDATGQTSVRNMEMIAVDVTVETSQTLNYTKDTSLQVGGGKVSIPMYRFPHNASDKGITTKIEIYKNDAWETLETIVVKDTYTHNVTIDPTGLSHGAYPLRIQGTDVASGIEGNILHTAVMVIETRDGTADYDKPIVVARWSDASSGTAKLFETVKVDLACYQRSTSTPTVTVTVTDTTTGVSETIASKVMSRSSYYTVEKRLVGYSIGDTLTFDATCAYTDSEGNSQSASLVEPMGLTISGSLLEIAETEGAYYKISLAGRSNSDTDKSIKTTASDGTEIGIAVNGSNYSTNGFVADNFGTEEADGRMALRVAENVTAECTDKPFASNTIPTNGLALSLTFKVKNIASRTAHIIKCMGDRLGFVLTGEKFIVTTNGDSDTALANVFTTAATSYLDDTVYRIDIVIEPQARAPYSGVMLCKIYQNGDEAACVPIDVSTSFPTIQDTIHFDGTDADLYLYEIVRWNTYYDFIQAFNNYIVNLTDTAAMLTEYEQNQCMDDVTAEGTTKPRPDMQKLLDNGVMVCVMTRTADKNLTSDGSAVTDSEIYYPDYLEDLKDKKTKVLMNLYLYFPDRPWANCMVEAVPGTNQGTSTLAYALKNKKFKFKKAVGITLLYTREEISQMYDGDEDVLAKYDDALKLAKKNKIRIKEGSTPINTITVKVDYSDSAGANNCAMMQLMNETQIALGSNYKTPAQNFNTNSDEELHTSIDGVTCALFRTDYKIGQDKGSAAAQLPENAYFHSKANFNADKDNPHFFGFEDVPGYNKGCVNYGDFEEMVAPQGTAIDDYKATVLSNTSVLVPGTLYMLSEFCGPETRFIENDGTGTMSEVDAVSDAESIDKTLADIQADSVSKYDWATVYLTSDGKYVQYQGGTWKDTTGTMTYDSTTKKWNIVGRVLNPVECYEYRQYQEFCWQQGVNTVDDMLKTLSTDDGEVPVWTTYYESRYPDDDNLNALYSAGKKVPYRLFAELQFCQQCNQNLTEDATKNAATDDAGNEIIFNGAGASTTISLDGSSVDGTTENRRKKWQHEMHKWFNPYSTLCYVVSSDYKATVDQRAKNMMIAFYKETDSTVRGYFNHWYDGDSVDEADNDCYLTIPWDMDGATSHLYQGWDGVMFRQTYSLFDDGLGVWVDDSGKTTLTLHDVAAAMRATKTNAGLDIFSAAGCYRYWMTNRILKWPKVVSSFDGERKYIETATAADNHYPALHGLRLESLPAFQRKRFAYRDGYFQTGDLFKHFFQARMMGPISVKITAAQDGYFGMGVDSTSSAKYSCYLKAGESHTFTETATDEGGKLIYIFGADKLSELDLCGCTPKNSNWVIAECTLLRKLIIGSESYSPSYTDGILSALNLGRMPFLEELDIRNTQILTLNAQYCPRLKSVLAGGSQLQSFTPAESSPLATLQLPATMTTLSFVNLPKLGYPNGGLTFDGLANVTMLQLVSCPNIDARTLLENIISAGGKLADVLTDDYEMSGNSSTLETMKTLGTVGIGTDDTTLCDGLHGTWTLTNLLDDTTFAALVAYFPNLTLYNAQYTMMEFDDNEENGYDGNITNMDNGSKDGVGDGYVASGHITKLQSQLHVYKGTYDESAKKMKLQQISDSDMQQLADGTSVDLLDSTGTGYDIFLGLPHYWYKGINDHVNQKKYMCLSTETSTPRSTATKVQRNTLSELLVKSLKAIYVANYAEGDTFSEDALQDNTVDNVYKQNVEGMKQVRWPGVNSDAVGGVFLDKEGKVISTVTTVMANANTDFVLGEYVFTDVPTNAVSFLFSSPSGYDDLECIAVDSAAVEAIEPDWVEHNFELIGVYKGSIDALMRLRSISGAEVKVGTGTSATYSGWKYDSDGNPSSGLPQSGTTLNYTCKDFQNLAKARGTGFQLVDYEMHKDIANLWMAIHGRRNSQGVNGSGVGRTNTGSTDASGRSPFFETSSGRPRTLGLEDWWGCAHEWMDNVAINVASFDAYYKNKSQVPSGSSVDHIWRIKMSDGTERAVKGVTNSGDNQEICRVKFGRYCDVIPSKFVTNSSMNTYYCDAQWYIASTGRCVLRSGSGSYSVCGFVCVGAGNDASHSYSVYGSRLAFRGACEIV